MKQPKIVTMILAGGKGERLHPLTVDRSKPAVPFAGSSRIIDFTLMNCVMSGFRRINVLTQYHSQSLSSHVQDRWSFLSRELGETIEMIPPKLRSPTGYYKGTADAIYRNLDILDADRPDVVLILSGDHVYRADYRALIERHLALASDVTVLCGSVDEEEARSFGVVSTRGSAIQAFIEKPENPAPFATAGRCKINLGVYCFNTAFLVERLVEDARTRSAHDFGRNILPRSVAVGSVNECAFESISVGLPYWRDVGSIDSYFRCHQDLLDERPVFDLADSRWPRGSRFSDQLPVRLASKGDVERGWSLICAGSQIDRARIVRSVVSPGVTVGRGATLDHCVVLGGVTIGRNVRIRNAVIDEDVTIPEGTQIGHGNESHRFAVSPGGVVVIERGYRFPGEEPAKSEASYPERQRAIRVESLLSAHQRS